MIGTVDGAEKSRPRRTPTAATSAPGPARFPEQDVIRNHPGAPRAARLVPAHPPRPAVILSEHEKQSLLLRNLLARTRTEEIFNHRCTQMDRAERRAGSPLHPARLAGIAEAARDICVHLRASVVEIPCFPASSRTQESQTRRPAARPDAVSSQQTSQQEQKQSNLRKNAR